MFIYACKVVGTCILRSTIPNQLKHNVFKCKYNKNGSVYLVCFQPKGAGSRCLDCKIEETCPYSAKGLYLSSVSSLCV